MNILTGNCNNLFIVPHADDEALGFGGLISRLVGFKRHVRVVTCFARKGMRGRMQISSAENAQKILGYDDLIQLKLSSDCNDRVLISALEKQITAYSKLWSPECINNVWSVGDSENHQDHQKLFRAMCAALRPAHIKCVESFFTGEIISSTDQAVGSVRARFIPNTYVCISADDLQKKMEAIQAYVGERSRSRNETAVRAYATKRGGECGVIYAEAFMLHRSIE
jgi:LmbE family N-acetylglucosaminyl deacetylase